MELFSADEFGVAVSKDQAIEHLRRISRRLEFEIVEENADKPWGAYLRFSSDNADRFCELFFSDAKTDARYENLERSPKFLLIAPGKRLSWQYHFRRAERWRFLTSGAYVRSKTDAPEAKIEAPTGTEIQFATEERHRLCGGESWTVVAEIWQHTSPEQPSDEADIVRLDDDFQRQM